jgi:hypothetical protein
MPTDPSRREPEAVCVMSYLVLSAEEDTTEVLLAREVGWIASSLSYLRLIVIIDTGLCENG